MPSPLFALSDQSLTYRETQWADIPILLRPDGIAFEASHWLLVLRADECRSLNTVKANAQGLSLWYRFLDKNKISWREAVRTDILKWRDTLLGHGRNGKTVLLRLLAVCQFYKWAAAQGLIDNVPFLLRSVSRRGNALAPSEQSQVLKLTRPRLYQTRTQTFTKDQFDRVRANSPGLNLVVKRRNDLMFRWGWCTGLRRAEVTLLDIHQIQEAIRACLPSHLRMTSFSSLLESFHATDDQAFVLTLKPGQTKRCKGGQILVPRGLIKKTVEWIASDRMSLLRFNTRLRKSRPASDIVFITSRGKQMSPATLSRLFRTACRTAETGGRLHMLRHSFGTRLLEAAHILESPDGLRLTQLLMRHASAKTTEGYLHLIETRNDLLTAKMLVCQLDSQVSAYTSFAVTGMTT